MKSPKQRRAELDAKKRAKAEKAVAEKKDAVRAAGVDVDLSALAPNNSYGDPAFALRGYYVDKPFTCKECGKEEVWTARQQKWWYEVAKGFVYSTATLCRACRRCEQARRAKARRASEKGAERKKRK